MKHKGFVSADVIIAANQMSTDCEKQIISRGNSVFHSQPRNIKLSHCSIISALLVIFFPLVQTQKKIITNQI